MLLPQCICWFLVYGMTLVHAEGWNVDMQECKKDDWEIQWAHVNSPNIPHNSSFVLRSNAFPQCTNSTCCMNVEAWGKKIGDKIWITRCHDETPPKVLNRVWIIQENGTILNPVSGLCLDARQGGLSPIGTGLALRDCSARDNTKWIFDTKSGQIKSQQSGLCVGSIMFKKIPVTLTMANQPIAQSARDYVSFNFDWHPNSAEPPAWINMSVQVIDLDNVWLQQAARALSPAHLRIGGSQGDVVCYDVPDYNSTCASMNQSDPAMCLKMDRWQGIVKFAQKNELMLVFGLNAMYGRPGHNQKLPLNFSNIEAFLRYTANNKLAVYGFEFGNELPKIPPQVYAADYNNLRKLINKLWPKGDRPLLIGNDMNSNPKYLNEWLPLVADSLDVLTYHHYDGKGTDPKLQEKIMTSSYLDGTRQPNVVASWKNYAPHTKLWVGEAAAAWHSGRAEVTNAFCSCFWYADALAADAALNHSAYCRQTLLGGYYGLLNRTTYQPNPDYYIAKLHHDLMGEVVFHPQVNDTTLRAYAQCSRGNTKNRQSLTLLLINIDSTNTYSVTSALPLVPRQEYILTAEKLSSRIMKLNGIDILPQASKLPELHPRVVTEGSTLTIGPQSIAYYVLQNTNLPACN